MTTDPASPSPAAAWRWLLVGIVLLTVILVPFLLWERPLTELARTWLGAPAPAVVALAVLALLVGDVVLPVPSSLVAIAAGASLGRGPGFAVILAGMTIGCVVGYVLGARGGRPLLRRAVGAAALARSEAVLARRGPPALALLRPVPVLAEASILLAGAARVPFGPFLAVTTASNAGVAAVYAIAGAAIETRAGFLASFAAALLVPAVGLGLLRLVDRPAAR